MHAVEEALTLSRVLFLGAFFGGGINGFSTDDRRRAGRLFVGVLVSALVTGSLRPHTLAA
jgi:hypothetical protein